MDIKITDLGGVKFLDILSKEMRVASQKYPLNLLELRNFNFPKVQTEILVIGRIDDDFALGAVVAYYARFVPVIGISNKGKEFIIIHSTRSEYPIGTKIPFVFPEFVKG